MRLTGTAGGGGVGGKPIQFWTTNRLTGQRSQLACKPTTDAAGFATCSGTGPQIAAVLGGGYEAIFPGDAVYLASTAFGTVARLAGNDIG